MKTTVSCLMVTKNRLPFVKRSLKCFLEQSYRYRELIVVNDADDGTREFIEALHEPAVRYVRPTQGGLMLGELRNIAVESASGQLVMQWDDDDWYHPDRIRIQIAALKYTGARACCLSRWTLAWPDRGLFYLSKERYWEGSILCWKMNMPKYLAVRFGEDTRLVQDMICRGLQFCSVDHPELYVYVCHGSNTYPIQHFERNVFKECTATLDDATAAAIRETLQLP